MKPASDKHAVSAYGKVSEGYALSPLPAPD